MRLTALLTTVFLLLAVAVPLPAQEISDPDLFAKSLQAAHQALEQYGRYDNPEELKRVCEIGYRLAQESKFTAFPFTFYLIDMPEPNAFALPGGQIFVTRGMLDLGLTDDMLAGLMGHELAHVVLRHGIRMQRRATILNILSQALLVGVMLGSDSGRRDRGPVPPDPYGRRPQEGTADRIQGAAAATLVVSELLLRSYSREFEDEADEEGQRWAAAAGFDPNGYRDLMALMSARLPESKEYGYWRTHPFFEQRIAASRARGELLKRQEPRPADAFRARTQEVLLAYVEGGGAKLQNLAIVKEAALAAWPTGPSADRLRLERLHQLRDAELAKISLARDYGRILEAYRKELEEVQALSPQSPLLATLRNELGDLTREVRELYPKAVKIFNGGVYETAFLENFLSNYPDAPEVPRVALALAVAYNRLGNLTAAVEHYLRAWQAAPESSEGKRAREGLRNLAPTLERLAALQQLALQEDDPELQRLARNRLDEIAQKYTDIANGAEYLRRFPGGEQTEAVVRRLNALAENLYGEVVLYQGVGDNMKALERIQKILTYAPLSPAAERLRERAILAG